MKKTNAMRILDGLKIPYEVREYEDNTEHELAKGAAARIAEKLAIEPSQVFKTIVMRSEKKELFVLKIPKNKRFSINFYEGKGTIWEK